jgi:hypothetical protein
MTTRRSDAPTAQRPGVDAPARHRNVTPSPLAPVSARGLLALQRAAGNAAATRLLAPVQRAAATAKKPPPTGVAKYGTVRLTDRLQDMMNRGVLDVAGAPATLDREQLFVLQGVANVETGGVDNAVYTKDNMYVSLGFKQVTLGWGSLYDIMKAVPAAFAKHGIVLGSGTYSLKAGQMPAVEGAPDPKMLKTPPWTDRFFDAGAEDEVVSAIVAFTLKELGRMERRFAHDSPGKSSPWMKDPTARAWLLEALNNRPAYAYAAAKATLAKTSGAQLTRDAFLDILSGEIKAAFVAHDEGAKGEHVVTKISRNAPAAAAGQPAPPAATGAASTPAAPVAATGAGADLVAKAATVLPTPVTAGSAGGALLQAIAAAGLIGPALRLLAGFGYTDPVALTNIAFWAAHPQLFGSKLHSSQPGFPALAAEWIHLRDGIVKEATAGPGKPAAKPATHTATQPPSGQVPAAEVVAKSAAAPATGPARTGTAGAGRTSASDKYFVQDAGHYQDIADSGKTAGQVRVWMYGSSGANICNMTTLTMALTSMVGESEVRTRMIGLLRSNGMHTGASVQVGGVWVPLGEALDNAGTVARIQTIDLVTAVAIGRSGEYQDVTDADVMSRIARDAGISADAAQATGKVKLTDPTVRQRAAQMLADGKRVIAGTVNHYVYLLEIRADGVLVHDPAGARVTPDLVKPYFIHSGAGAHIAKEYLAMDAGRRTNAVRRVTTNPTAAAVINQLPGIAALAGQERAVALKQLAKDHPEYISTGALNFYANSEFEENHLRLRVTMSAA